MQTEVNSNGIECGHDGMRPSLVRREEAQGSQAAPRRGASNDADIVLPGRGLQYPGQILELNVQGCLAPDHNAASKTEPSVEVWLRTEGLPLRLAARLIEKSEQGVRFEFQPMPLRKQDQLETSAERTGAGVEFLAATERRAAHQNWCYRRKSEDGLMAWVARAPFSGADAETEPRHVCSHHVSCGVVDDHSQHRLLGIVRQHLQSHQELPLRALLLGLRFGIFLISLVLAFTMGSYAGGPIRISRQSACGRRPQPLLRRARRIHLQYR